jgi:hypothetical protein
MRAKCGSSAAPSAATPGGSTIKGRIYFSNTISALFFNFYNESRELKIRHGKNQFYRILLLPFSAGIVTKKIPDFVQLIYPDRKPKATVAGWTLLSPERRGLSPHHVAELGMEKVYFKVLIKQKG